MDFSIKNSRPTPGREAPTTPGTEPAELAVAATNICAATHERETGELTASQADCQGARTMVDEAEEVGFNRTFPPKASEPLNSDTLNRTDIARDVQPGLDIPERDGERQSRAPSRSSTRVLRSSRDSLRARSRTPIARSGPSHSSGGSDETKRERTSEPVQCVPMEDGPKAKDGGDQSLVTLQPQVVLTRLEDEAAYSDSAASMITVSTRSRSSHEALNESPSRKRTREAADGRSSRASYNCKGTKGRGRGRPITTGARAEKLLKQEIAKKAKWEAWDEEALNGVLEWSRKMTEAKNRAEYLARELTSTEMVQSIRPSCDSIYFAADKSRHLSGPFERTIKQGVAMIMGAVETLVARSPNEEIRRLSAQNENLKFQLEELKKEVLLLKAERSAAAVPATASLTSTVPTEESTEPMAVDSRPCQPAKKKKPAPTTEAPKVPSPATSRKAPAKKAAQKQAPPQKE
ncbi:hypothetical protein ABMA28_006026, partial [Loxostege sticticalis]